MTKLGDEMWHERHSDFECFDKITFEVVPRYKMSGLSGDEWRQHVEVTFWFKGHAVVSWGARDMRCAAMMLSTKLLESASPLPDAVLEIEADACDQPSCAEPPTHRYILKKRYSRSDGLLDTSDGHPAKRYRQFCEKHGVRGDCGLEDADSNYEKVAI